MPSASRTRSASRTDVRETSKRCGELPLRREPVAGREVSGRDRLLELEEDLLERPPTLHRSEEGGVADDGARRHWSNLSRSSPWQTSSASSGVRSGSAGSKSRSRRSSTARRSASEQFETLRAAPLERVYTPEHAERALRGRGLPGRVPVPARAVPDDVPGAALDDASDRRLRRAGGHERAGCAT